jgi:hypothetical protein
MAKGQTRYSSKIPAPIPDSIFNPNMPQAELRDVWARIDKGYYVPHRCLKAVVNDMRELHARLTREKMLAVDLRKELERKIADVTVKTMEKRARTLLEAREPKVEPEKSQ